MDGRRSGTAPRDDEVRALGPVRAGPDGPCPRVADLKVHLQTTDYGDFLADHTNPLTVAQIDTEMRRKLCGEFEYFRNHALGPLSTFLSYMT